jgi:hypothetical protein
MVRRVGEEKLVVHPIYLKKGRFAQNIISKIAYYTKFKTIN